MGGDGADSLAGGEARDVLFGGEGSDIVFAGGDADVVLGGGGDDRLFGEAGADVVVGNAGSDRLIGGIGDDVLVGGVGTDTYVFAAGDGQDRIVDAGQNYLVKDGRPIAGLFVRDPQSGAYGLVNDQSVTLTFASPATISFGGGDSVTLLNQTEAASFAQGAFGIRLLDAPSAPTGEVRTFFGDKADYDSDAVEPGVQTQTDAFGNTVRADGQDGRPDTAQDGRADTLYGSTGSEVERFATAGGDDLVYADGPSSAASTAGGRDLIEAGAGRDVVHAGGAEDWVEGGTEADILGGGAGDDALWAETTSGRTLTLEQALLSGETGATAPGQGDLLTGDAGEDLLVGAAASDFLAGGEGADLVVGGAGDDNLYGDVSVRGAVLDWTVMRTVTTTGGTATYILDSVGLSLAGTGATATGSGDAIYGGAGADWVFAGAGDDYVEGGNTPDDANVEDDVLFGEAGSDILVGGSGKDALHGDSASVDAAGLSGDDYLDGGPGDDTLRGGGGADVLVGGEGNDTLIGNASGAERVASRKDPHVARGYDENMKSTPLDRSRTMNMTILSGAGYDQIAAMPARSGGASHARVA
jgi:Ca2+-binding RTX toxin-like protein